MLKPVDSWWREGAPEKDITYRTLANFTVFSGNLGVFVLSFVCFTFFTSWEIFRLNDLSRNHGTIGAGDVYYLTLRGFT